MIKLYCDRCKKLIKENTQVINLDSYCSVKEQRYGIGENEFFIVSRYVFCQDCLHDFTTFMREKENK